MTLVKTNICKGFIASLTHHTTLPIKKKKSTYIKYYDFKNQYGWSLSKKLPHGGHEYIKDISMCTSNLIINYKKNSNTG